MQVAQYAQQVEQAAQYYAQREGAMSEIMTNPSLLAPYYLDLERVFGEVPVDQPRQPDPQQPQFQGQIPMSQMGAGVGMMGQRPVFPAPPNQMPTANKLEALKSAPPTVAWRVLDQLSPADWRQTRLIF